MLFPFLRNWVMDQSWCVSHGARVLALSASNLTSVGIKIWVIHIFKGNIIITVSAETFLDASTHLYKSVSFCHLSVHPSIRPSVHPSVGPLVCNTFFPWAEFGKKMVENYWEHSLKCLDMIRNIPSTPYISPKSIRKVFRIVPKWPIQTHRCPNGLVVKEIAVNSHRGRFWSEKRKGLWWWIYSVSFQNGFKHVSEK